MHIKSLTLRLPEGVYKRLKAKKDKTITGFIVEAIQEKLERDHEQDLAEGFANLAGEVDEETRGWMGAQKKAMKHVDR